MKALCTRRQFLQTGAAAGASLLCPFAAARLIAASESSQPAAESQLMTGPARGHWRRLFLDASVVEQQDGLSRVFHPAEKHPANPVIHADKPWEGPAAITGPYVYGTILWDQDKLRMWYQVLMKGNHVAYAESRDGISWTKPDLGIIEFEGSRANNLVVSAFNPARTGGHCHNPSVIRCPPSASSAYALYGFDPEAGHARVAFSQDGLHWRFDPSTRSKPLFSSSDVVNFFYDSYEERFVATWKTRNRRGRAVGVAWSRDGLVWTKALEGPVFVADDLDPDATQVYGMPVFPYQGLYIGQPWFYQARYFKSGNYSVAKLHEAQEDSPRTMEVQLAWSWDLINWSRPPERPQFIPRGPSGNWDGGMICTARAPVVVGDKLHFYFGGCDGLHDDKRVNAAIGLATLRLDGFCSMHAGASEGWFISRREASREPAVILNARTAAHGYVAAEILDRRNRVVSGFSRNDCLVFTGDAVRTELKWKTDRLPGRFAGDYKLRFYLKRADLFSYVPKSMNPDEPDLARF